MGVAVEIKNTAPPRLHLAFAGLGLALLAIFSWMLLKLGSGDARSDMAEFSAA